MNAGPAGDLQPLISVEEFKALQANPRLVVLDARIARSQRPDGSTQYSSGLPSFRQDGHIPGALFADLFEAFSDVDAPFPFTRPATGKLPAILQSLGIGRQSLIVVYDSLNGVWAARLWWVLTAAGVSNVRLLNGGLAAWKASDGPIAFDESGPPAPATAFEIVSLPAMFVDLPQVLSIVGGDTSSQLVCALREADFEAGHIPGSKLIAFPSILSPDGQIDPDLAERAAGGLGLSSNDPLILYCGGGVNAAGVGIALRAAGFKNLSVYDGSLSEWKADPSRPLVKGDASA